LGITLGLAFGAPMVQAAPLCSEVLQVLSTGKISAEELGRTLADVARLKIIADKELSIGKAGNSFVSATSIYQKKYAELVGSLDGVKTKSDIKKLVAQKISSLQGKIEITAKEEQAKREVEKEHLSTINHYDSYTTTLVLGMKAGVARSFNQNRTVFEYVPALDSLLFYGEKFDRHSKLVGLYLYNLRTEKIETLLADGPHFEYKTSGNGRFVLVATGDKLLIFDLQTGSHRLIDFYNPGTGVEINPSGTMLVTYQSIRKSPDQWKRIYDLTTGEKIEVPELSEEYLGALRFISDNELIYLAQEKEPNANGDYFSKGVFKYNLKTKVTEHILTDYEFKDLEVSQDQKRLFLTEKTPDGMRLYSLAMPYFSSELAPTHLVNYDKYFGTYLPNKGDRFELKPLPGGGLGVNYREGNPYVLTMIEYHAERGIWFGRDSRMKVGLPAVDEVNQRIFTFENSSDNTAEIKIWKPTRLEEK
jgi:hypothetical protein